jgi:protein N-terminal asparagine amidohydrolase
VNVKTGALFPATLPDKGPDLAIRLARTLTGSPDSAGLLDIYCPDREELRIGPLSYWPMRSVDMWLEQTDEFILHSLHPCPEVVPDKEAFVRQVHHICRFITQVHQTRRRVRQVFTGVDLSDRCIT